MKDLVILSHIISGGLVLLLGLVLMLLRKGNRRHKTIGWIYVISMWWVCLSAFISITFFNFSLFLLVIGILTFYSTYQGFRVIRRSDDFKVRWYDHLVMTFVMGAGLGLIGYGIYLIINHTHYLILAGLSLVFGVFTFLSAYRDFKFYQKSQPDDSRWWLYQHIGAMGGSYISAFTAFTVQNGEIFSLPGSMAWLPWVLPGVLGSVIISKVIIRYKKMNGQFSN